MRDLLFRNLTSEDKKRKILTSSEVIDSQGVRSIIHRHFICIIKEIHGKQMERPMPYLYVLKERNNIAQKEKFFCRMKSSLYAVHKGRLFLVLFMHSLKITLISAPQDLMKHN